MPSEATPHRDRPQARGPPTPLLQPDKVGRSVLRALILFGTLTAGTPALAQISTDQARTEADQTSPRDRVRGLPTLKLRFDFGTIGEDFFVTFTSRFFWNQELWGFGLALPLRFRVKDFDPDDQEDYLGILRKEDWDEPTDFFRLLRYVYFGKADRQGPYYVRVGDIEELELGHGTIVYRYYNGFDLDRWRAGLLLTGRTRLLGAEGIFSDLGRINSDVGLVGLRTYLHPQVLFEAPIDKNGDGIYGGEGDEPKGGQELQVGFSFFADPTAPIRLNRTPGEDLNGNFMLDEGEDSNGNGVLDPVRILLDDERHAIVEERRFVGALGTDVHYRLFEEEWLTITPYADFNKLIHGGTGLGLHLGVRWQSTFQTGLAPVSFDARTEYRRTSGDYEAPYFGMTHEIERFDSPPGSGVTKLEALRRARDLPWRNGYFLSLVGGMVPHVYGGIEYVDRGPNLSSLRLSLQLKLPYDFEVETFYYRFNISGGSDLFGLDDRTALLARVQIPIISVFGVSGEWVRVFRAGAEGVGYEAVDAWNVGLAVSITL